MYNYYFPTNINNCTALCTDSVNLMAHSTQNKIDYIQIIISKIVYIIIQGHTKVGMQFSNMKMSAATYNSVVVAYPLP